MARRHPGERWFELYRGTNDADDYEILQELGKHERLVRLNNLSSFMPDQERAFEFGGTVWRALVPLVKVFFWSRLLPESILKGEDEFLVIGGVYRVCKVL
jgi:NAD+--dinitrogen-reductase ADP-D-ribosyltransferase